MLPVLYPQQPQAAPSFFEPGDGRSFLETVKDWTPSYEGAARLGAAVGSQEGRELLTAAASNSALNRYLSSRDRAIEEVADLRIDAIRRATGVELQNPYRNGYNVEARQRVAGRRFDPDFDPRAGIPGVARDIFNEAVSAVAAEHPDKVADLDLGSPLEAKARAIATAAEDALPGVRARAAAAGMSPQQQMVIESAASMGAGLKDPMTLFSMVAGPGFAFGRTSAMRIFTEAAGQGGFNVGLLLAEHPTIEAWRQERGRAPGGHLPTAQETAIAFAAGAIPGAGIRVLMELLPKVRPDITSDVIRAGERAAEADRAVAEAIPPTVPRETGEEALAQAARHDADPAHEPPAPIVYEVPTVPEGMIRLFRAGPSSATLERHKGMAPSEWLRETPEYQNTVAASGRWFDESVAGAQWYIDHKHHDQMYYLDVPRDIAEKYRVSNFQANADKTIAENPRAFSRVPESEFFLPLEYRDAGRPISPQGKFTDPLAELRAIAAEHAPNPSDHVPVLERLEKEAPQTSKEARVIAADEVAGQSVKSEAVALQAQVAEKPRIGTVPEERRSLVQFLAGRGGIAHTDELRALFGDRSSYIRPYGKLLKEDAEQLAVRAEQAFAAGYIAEPSEKALLAAIEGEVGGTKVYRTDFAAQGAERDAAKLTAAETKAAKEKARTDLFAYLAETGSEIRPSFPGSEVSNRRIFKEAIGLLSSGEEADVAAALRRAAAGEFEKETAKAATRRKSAAEPDPMDTIPTPAEDGTTMLLSREETALRIEDKQSLADLVRSCKE